MEGGGEEGRGGDSDGQEDEMRSFLSLFPRTGERFGEGLTCVGRFLNHEL